MNRKITETGYYLPTVTALNPVEVFTSGVTLPLNFIGVCRETGLKNSYVLKGVNAHEMSIEASCRELIASFIAMELELHVAPPAIAIIHQEFVDAAIKMNPQCSYLSNCLDINYCCEFLPYTVITDRYKIPKSLSEDARNIFLFDALISNPDRTPDKQNMLTNGEKIVIFDHQKAFSFVLALFGGNKTPWNLDQVDAQMLRQHYFFPHAQKTINDFSEFFDKLPLLTDDFWSIVPEYIPISWHNSQLVKIKETIRLIVSHREEFLESIKKVVV